MTQVISLELSKKLAEAGLKIETEKWWHIDPSKTIWTISDMRFEKEDYPASSTDELLAVIDREAVLEAIHFSDIYVEHYRKFNKIAPALIFFEFIKNVENIGKMILWLLSNGWRYNPETKMIEKGL